MTETSDTNSTATASTAGQAPAAAPKKRSGGLNSMLLADLKAMASGMGIAGASGMKKANLVAAIKAAQSGQSSAQAKAGNAAPTKKADKPVAAKVAEAAPQKAPERVAEMAAEPEPRKTPEATAADRPSEKQPEKTADTKADTKADNKADNKAEKRQQGGRQDRQQDKQGGQDKHGGQQKNPQAKDQPKQGGNQPNQPNQNKQGGQGKQDQSNGQGKQDPPAAPAHDNDNQDDDNDGEGGSRRNRRRRGRDRDRTGGRTGREPDTEVREDDVLVPAAGILDVLDNYAFVRTTGYLAGPDDVYLSLSMVRKYGLRRGDAIAGQVRQPREGERREKFNPMVRIETVNGVDPEQARTRVEFDALVPIAPTERLRMETSADNLTGRMIDLAAPVGKGQRGLVLSPSGAGKTVLLQSMAQSITTNNPECHLMVVLVDERPEEVTDFTRGVKGEVIASPFDRPAADHTALAELAIERAKRLVELGHDVVLLVDGLSRLGRAYNLTVAASGRVLPGGVDAAALYPPKKFFGAARNVENGGSLTIIATALVDSGSKIDEAVLDALTGTPNLQLRLRSEAAERGVFPAIDLVASGTRRAELLLGAEEVGILDTLRRELADLDPRQATASVLERLRRHKTNYELLLQVQRTGK